MKKLFSLLFFSLCFTSLVFSQMWNGQDSLYGNEWINYDQDYYKLMLAEDGLYRISQQTLVDAGIPVSSIQGSSFRLFYMGQEIPIFTTTSSTFGVSDYIEFYGRKNRGTLDRFLFKNPDQEMLNPEYSMFTDTSSYYLTWDTGSGHQRVEVVSNSLNNLPNAEAYYLHEELVNLHETMIQDVTTQGISYSSFEDVEGFANRLRRTNNVDVPVSNIASSGPNSILYVRMTGNTSEHELEISLNNEIQVTDNFNGYQVRDYEIEVDNSELTNTNRVKLFGAINAQDRNAPSIVGITYPREFNFSDRSAFQFSLKGSSTKKYLEISNFNEAGADPILYDITNHKRIIAAFDPGNDMTRISIPPESGERELHLANTVDGIKLISSLSKTSFVDLTSSSANYIILSHPALFDDGNGQNWVQEYADYRSSAVGGNYTTQIIDINQLYDQFAYGIHRTPLSIRNFGNYIKKEWPKVSYFFIIGKSREYSAVRTEADLALDINQTFYVPTFGVPGADNLLLSTNRSSVPVIPIGRIAIQNPDELKNYLDKVTLLESNENLPQTFSDRAWQKRVLHLSGGDPTIQASIAGYLGDMEEIIENNEFGADVTTFYKTSTDPVQISESEEIFELINNGVSILTFFGHSGVGTFDFNIDNPDNYFNYGKYPQMFSLGCFSGNIHTSATGISERFVFYKDKGAISFIASTGQGFISVLRQFAGKYYDLLGDEMYGMGIGDVLRSTLAEFDNNQSLTVRTLHQQFTLHGDPAIRLNPRPGPDYVVDASTVSFEPTTVSSQLDSFTINFAVNNIGRNTIDSFHVKVEQQLPGGDLVTLVLERVEAPGFGNNLSYTVPNFGVIASGQNRIFITVDVDDEVAELPGPMAEMNNELYGGDGEKGVSLYITDNSAKAIYPEEFGIVGTPQVDLKSSTRNTMVGEQKYIYQIDTTELFNSPLLQTQEITQIGGVIEWTPSIPFENETVYYWRISPDSTDAEVGYVWDVSSFVYLEGSEKGWNQSHFYQYKKDQFDGMEVKIGEEFDFWVNGFNISIRNKVKEPDDFPTYTYNFETPAATIQPWNYLTSGIAVVVADSTSGYAWFTYPGNPYYGSVMTNNYTNVFAFPTQTVEERENLMTFLEDVISDKEYVFLFSVLQDFNQDFLPEEWEQDSISLGKNIFSVLESQGATKVRQLKDRGSVPYTFIYQKGVKVFGEDIALNKDDIIQTDAFIPVLRTDGSIESTKIGPASSWESFIWDQEAPDEASETYFVSILGIDNMGNQVILRDSLQTTSLDLSFINASEYPYLKIQYFGKDENQRTASNLNYWRVFYEGLPEAGINPAKELVVYNDTIQRGEVFSFKSVVENIGTYDMDSLLIKFSYTDGNNLGNSTNKRFAPLLVGETMEVDFELETRPLSGPIDFTLEVNPNEDQPELYHFNNIANYRFLVDQDNRNPLLDVTFDGVHIMDGDIVSSKPEIFITLKDENPFLLLEDTSLIKIYLTDPLGTQRQFYFSQDTAKFYPADNNRNRASIVVNPELQMDGNYQLIVQAQDVTGNQSGDLDYKINFEVITKQSISNVLNYPNPFSTSTQFVYTLTGDQAPSHFKIQIFTVSGKIVKEITEQEIGPLKVGTHRTDYTWDGTDDYGQRLANGVYLYRVVAKDSDGENFEKYQTNTNQFFQDDFGKLVILR